ncbi:putative ribonuclease H-like domain-containing protein [Tanacetum coccineum]
MCDKKNSVLFPENECLVLSPDFKLLDESQVLLKVPRQNNMYSFDLKNIVPSGGLTCLFAKATIDESNLWHRRLGHINFKTINKLVRGNLVRGIKLIRMHVQDNVDAVPTQQLFCLPNYFMISSQSIESHADDCSTIEEEVYMCQPSLVYEDHMFPDRVYKVEKALYGLHQAPKAWYETLSTYLLKNGFRRGTIDKTFSSKRTKTVSTPIETNKALLKDEEAEDVDLSARFQVTPKVSHIHVVKRIFRYLKGQSKLGLWYPRDLPFDLEAFFIGNYARASLDRKSTTGGCPISCKRLWIQNQMLDYGVNFMNTKIYIDNESTICIVKNPVFHSKTKHIEIRHHFIIDSYEKRLIQVIKIHTDHNVADLLTKAFDVSMFNFLIASIGLLNL